MKLDSERAQQLVDQVRAAATPEAARTCAARAWDFFVAQHQLLRQRANGYPANPINGETWSQGHRLAQSCDRFADVLQTRGDHLAEERAARLAAALACEVVGHYPAEIFPRVLRVAKCSERNGKSDQAVDDYLAIIGDFRDLGLDSTLDDGVELEDSDRCVLRCLAEALEAVERLAPSRNDADAAAWKAKARARSLEASAPGADDATDPFS